MRMTDWPAPSLDATKHSEELKAHIVDIIRKQGPISFAEYMQQTLYAPGLGYYSAGAQKFGPSGDYITAPELSPLFSYSVARQCQQVLNDLPEASVLEVGAGLGTMAADILTELERSQSLPDRYYILEVSADLRERQQENIKNKVPHLFERVEWLSRWPSEPIRGVIVANEVLDAMPVHKFKIVEGQVKEYFVAERDGHFIWEIGQPKTPALLLAIKNLNIEFSDEYESEINLWLPGWIAAVSDHLEQGLVLLIDYGFPRHEYYHPDRSMGTLMCHYRHHSHDDPLILTGLQDITNHVDFTAVAEVASLNHLAVSGFTHQAAFLLNSGLTDWMPDPQDHRHYFEVLQQIKKLTLPSEMGELFKVIALTKDYDSSLIGFSTMNQVERL